MRIAVPYSLTDLHQGSKSLPDPVYLFEVFGIGVFNEFKFLLVNIIPGIHPHLLHYPCGDFGSIGGEMNVRYERRVVALFAQFIFYQPKVLRFFFTWRSDAHQFCPGFDTTDRLLHGAHGVHSVGGGHGLHPYRVVITNQQVAHSYFQRVDSIGICCFSN